MRKATETIVHPQLHLFAAFKAFAEMRVLLLFRFALRLALVAQIPLGVMATDLAFAPLAVAQLPGPEPAYAEGTASVPRLIKYSGVLTDSRGYPITVPIDVRFSLYSQAGTQAVGEAEPVLWLESQRVAPNEKGAFTVYLGSASANGLPIGVFTSVAAHWLGVKAEDEPEQARVPLLSVPYALKAVDAQTLGGLPASAYALATPANAAIATSATPQLTGLTLNVSTTGGTAGYLPQFSSPSAIVDSPVFVSGSNVGIGTARPTAMLQVAGSAALGNTTISGSLDLPAEGLATTVTGQPSYPETFQASAWNTSKAAPVVQTMIWQAVPLDNNSTLASATLNFLSGSGVVRPVATGLSINANGIVKFVPKQTFPGAGTITSVAAGSGLVGGGTSGVVQLKIDATQVPLLSTTNTYKGYQQIDNSEAVTGSVSVGTDLFLPNSRSPLSGTLQLGTSGTFLSNYGPTGSRNAFIGGAGNFITTGSANTGTGGRALAADTSGGENTAMGTYAGDNITTGNGNTALGYEALSLVNTGYDDTAVGTNAGVPLGSSFISGSTAIGFNAQVSQSNSLILGRTIPASPGSAFVNVGVGTATPVSAMEISVNAPSRLGPVLTLTNPGGNVESNYAIPYAAVDFNTEAISTKGVYNPGARIAASDDRNNSAYLLFQSNVDGAPNSGLQTNMMIQPNGQVIVGYPSEVFSLPHFQFQAYGTSGSNAIYGEGAPGVAATGAVGMDGIYGVGGDGQLSAVIGGTGGNFRGGKADGDGVIATGGEGGDGIDAFVGAGASNSFPAFAGNFYGAVFATGGFTAPTSNVQIDHPDDPANKLLSHATIQSSEMINIYSGNVITDELGIATVTLPDWFESVNGDFRYQLTALGQFAQAIISREIENHKFVIRTNAQHVKVSWQVTGVRRDPYAKAHPLVVEQQKNERERGFYQNPELYGQPEEKQTEWGRHPQKMRHLSEMREQNSRGHAVAPAKRSVDVTPPASAAHIAFPSPARSTTESAISKKPALK